jgi:hypothetical protein
MSSKWQKRKSPKLREAASIASVASGTGRRVMPFIAGGNSGAIMIKDLWYENAVIYCLRGLLNASDARTSYAPWRSVFQPCAFAHDSKS